MGVAAFAGWSPARAGLRISSVAACLLVWQAASAFHVNLGVVTFANVPARSMLRRRRSNWDSLRSSSRISAQASGGFSRAIWLLRSSA